MEGASLPLPLSSEVSSVPVLVLDWKMSSQAYTTIWVPGICKCDFDANNVPAD